MTNTPNRIQTDNSYSFSGSEIQGGHCKLNTKADNADCTMWMTATMTGAVTSTTSATTMTFLDVQTPVTVTAGLEKLQAAPGSTASDASTTAPASTDASSTGPTQTGASSTGSTQTDASSTGPAQTTLSKHTSTGTQTGSSTGKPTSTNAAGIVNSQGGLLAGVAAIVGGVMML